MFVKQVPPRSKKPFLCV